MTEKSREKNWNLVGSGIGTGSNIPEIGSVDPDPDQNEADPKHSLKISLINMDLLIHLKLKNMFFVNICILFYDLVIIYIYKGTQ